MRLEPRRRLATRVTLFFLLAALPGAILGGGAVVILDRLAAQEIDARSEETVREAQRILEEESARVSKAVERLARHEALRELAAAVDGGRLERFEGLAASRAAGEGLELLGIVAARGPSEGQVIASAHLGGAVGDPGPAFLASVGPAEAVGLVHEYIEGNPPELVPALVAARLVESPKGRGALWIYGGVRLDGQRLRNVALAAGATLVLRSPGLKPRRFAPASGPAQISGGRRIPLSPLAGGLVLTELEEAAGTPRIEVAVHTGRLEDARRLFTWLAAALVLASLLLALLAGAYLSRRIAEPIRELSAAARRVGQGDLEVQLEPRSDDEVGSLVSVFNEMTRELAESRARLARAERLAAWREIARRVAHEIKNPLFPIRMTMETLRKSYRAQHPKLDEIVEESTKTILEEVQALNRIVTEFSDLARLPAPQKAEVSVAEVLKHVASLYGSDDELPGPRVVLSAAGLEALPPIAADRDQLGRALINLVKNAQEALEERGHGVVELSAHPSRRGERDGVVFAVRDDGPGMTEEVKAQLFTPYFTTKARGTGLGLAIVERIVGEHGGQVDVKTELGSGTTFELWLPRGDAPPG